MVEASIERGQEPPSWWREKPELNLMEERLLSMFFDIGTCRCTGTSPVPWTVAKEYAEYHHLNFKFFWQVMSALDSVYLEHCQREHEERMNRMDNSRKRGRGKRHG